VEITVLLEVELDVGERDVFAGEERPKARDETRHEIVAVSCVSLR
jgi:hypothetical protein